MPVADQKTYLADIVAVMKTLWPNNRTVNIVCHGHSVPSGYFETPMVDTFNAYPHLLHQALKARHAFAVINVIVTAIGGENSETGAERFEEQVLCHRPDIVTIDYALNDRGLGLQRAHKAWQSMVEESLSRGVKVILLTPTPDLTQIPGAPRDKRDELRKHSAQVCELADEYGVGLVGSLTAFDKYVENGGDLRDVLSQSNHPNRLGHEIVARELMRWFPVT
jgi:lysophospholipase L1-like esterase